MADEAFALSPISARATQPSEEDYDAISEAFMETARGRWFLGEYAKRNRNADTRMVLDAVARIEQALAAQKTEPPDNGLAEALAAIGSAVERARTATSAALDGLAAGSGVGPGAQGHPGDPGNFVALARNRRRRPDLRSDRFPNQGDRSGLRTDRLGGRRDPDCSAAFDLIEQRIEALDDSDTTRAFCSEVDTGSREENASN